MDELLPRVVTQLRALTRVFFGRFFESDITAGSNDLRSSVFYLLAFLAAPGAAAPFFVGMGASQHTLGPAGWGWSLIGTKLGPQALRLASLNDKTLYVALALVASAAVGAVVWNSLLPDRRDALVLGSMPVRPGIVVLARLLALTGFTLLIAVSMHTLASVSFAMFLSPGSGFQFFVRNVSAHFVASCAGSVFVLFAMTALQGLALVVAGPRRFSRVSPALQALVAATIVGGLCAVPALVAAAREIFRPGAADPSLVLRFSPPYWFLGLYEALLGNATPLAHRFATTAWSALGLAIGVTVVTYPLAYRRLMRSAVEGLAPPAWRSGMGDLTARMLGAGDLEATAVIRFVLTTFARVERHRFVIATAIGAGVAWATPGWIALVRDSHAVPSALVLSVPFSMLLFGLAGLRMAAALPADTGASWIFDDDLVPWRTARLALERVLIGLGIVPLALLSAAVCWHLWGAGAAAAHAALFASVGLLLAQALLWRMPGVPCSRPWTPGASRIRARWPVYLAILIGITSGMPAIERFLLSHAAAALLVVSLCAWLALMLRRAAIRLGPADIDAAPTIVAAGSAVDAAAGGCETVHSSSASSERTFAPRLQIRSGRIEAFLERISDALRALPANVAWRDEVQHLRRDVALAARAILRRPAFSIFSAVTIAIGLGATIAIQAVTYATLLKPVDIPQIDRVVNIYNQEPTRGSGPQITLSRPDYDDLRQLARSYEAMTAWTPAGASLVAGGTAAPLLIEAVDGAYFSFVGASVQLGRPIVGDDGDPGAPLTIVLSDAIWRRRFQADPSVVGQAVRVDDQQALVVGVAAPSVRGVFMPNLRPTEAWIPLAAVRQGAFGSYGNEDDRGHRFLFVKARLRSGFSVGTAGTELRSLANRLDKAFPLDPDPRFRRRWTLLPASDMHLVEAVTGYALPLATVLMLGVGLVFFVTCTNLANLTLARGATVQAAVAVRLALGASRRRLMQQQIVEVAIIASAGGVGAWLIVRALLDLVARGSVRLERGLTAHVAPTMTAGTWIALTGGLGIAVVICGVWPALRLTAVPITAALSADSVRVAGSWKGRRWMVATQVAASVVLLSTAALFLGELAARARPFASFGFDRVATVTLQLSKAQQASADLSESLRTIADRIRRQPGITAAAFTSALPLGTGGGGAIGDSSADLTPVGIALSSTEIFDALGVRLVAGRPFRDDGSALREVVVSESVARNAFGGVDVVGRTVAIQRGRSPAVPSTVVGIAADTPTVTPLRASAGWIYTPPTTTDASRVTLLARAAPGAAAPISLLQSIVRQVDPNLTIVDSTTAALSAGIDTPLSRVAGTVAAILGTAALLMSMIGLFGVLSQRVADRRRELGIRGALGAARGAILRLVILDGLRPVAMGFGIGIMAALLAQLSLQPFLDRIMPAAAWTVLLPIPLLLLLAALAACYLPARRALAVDPATAIRTL